MSALPGLKPCLLRSKSIDCNTVILTGLDFDTFEITQNLFVEDPFARYYYPEVTILTLGNEIEWAGFPREFFDDFQTELFSRSPFPHTYFVGYCNGHYTYFPTIEAAAKGGYGANYWTLLETGDGEILVDKTLVELFRLAGQLESR